MVIRPEESRDWRAIHALETAAFPSPAEAELVVALRRAGTVPLLSLVADDAGAIVAHAMFSPPEYYPRFGFVPASRFGIGSEYEAPDEAFMALELAPNALAGRTGLVRYHPTFAVVA